MIMTCINTTCNKTLQVKVNYCPFCGKSQKAVEPFSPHIVPSENRPVVLNDVNTNVLDESVHSSLNIPLEDTSENMTGLVTHTTKKTGKDLEGIILLSIDLDEAQKYDPYTFKKNNGVFIRLEHLAKVPDIFLDQTQLELKYKNKQPDDNRGSKGDITLTAPALKNESVPIPPPNPFEPENARIQPTIATDTPKKRSSILPVIAFVVVLGVIYAVFSGDDNESKSTTQQSGQENIQPPAQQNATVESSEPNQEVQAVDENQMTPQVGEDSIDVKAAEEKAVVEKLQADAVKANAEEEKRKADEVEAKIAEEKRVDQALQLRNAQDATERTIQQNLDRQNSEVLRQLSLSRQNAEVMRQPISDRQSAELLKQSSEQKNSSTLGNADNALRAKDYGTAKRMAKQVLASTPNNAQALRILRQAQDGEANAFDNMVIE